MKRILTRATRPALWLVAVVFCLGLVLDRWVFPLPLEKLRKDSGAFVYSREGYLLASFTSEDRFWRKPVAFEEISPRLIQSVLACEDQWFHYHPGINPVSLVQAAIDNLQAGKVVRGGSTITMQIARMMEPKRRTISAKLIEMLRATQLEFHFSKRELLEIYFNLAPYGGNIEGIGAATFFYFDKPPGELSWAEAAMLTAIPASPSQFRPDRNLDLCRQRRARVLERLDDEGVINARERADAEAEAIPLKRIKPPFHAPHFSKTLAGNHPDSSEIHTTVAFEIQRACERLATGHHGRLKNKDIHNLSIVVLDNVSGEVLAMIGSPDFEDTGHSGQVNGALAPRSPGSTLKPFVYALAFDEGTLSPERRVEDIPVNYSGYSPENYDEQYHGMTSVSEALIQSYNVPAVNAASRVGLGKLYRLLQAGGLATLKGEYYEYGLPLILGACEVRLLDLCNLYASLARGGKFVNARTLLGEEQTAPRQLLSRESCYLISQILVDLKRPDLPSCWEFSSGTPRVAWKTGTSYGRKDAWAVGYNARYTVGVWAGNFSARGSVDIVGAGIAAPLMFDVFNEIASGENEDWFDPPVGVASRKVCALTGRPPGESCPETIEELYIPGISPAAVCDVHDRILVDRDSGHRLCLFCRRGKNCDERLIEQWPSRIASWLANSGQTTAIPVHNPDCRGFAGGDAPVITSPEDGAAYETLSFVPTEYQKIMFEASAASGSGRLHWFLDGVLLASGERSERLFWEPTTGSHILLCVDDEGRSSTVSFDVQAAHDPERRAER